jgi:hypothetical protein
MKHSEEGNFKENSTEELQGVLKNVPSDYIVYILHADSIYPVTGIDYDVIDEGVLSFSSVETYGKKLSAKRTFTVKKLQLAIAEAIKEIKKYEGIQNGFFAEEAANLDTKLDMQLTEPYCINQWGTSNANKHFYLITGDPWVYC